MRTLTSASVQPCSFQIARIERDLSWSTFACLEVCRLRSYCHMVVVFSAFLRCVRDQHQTLDASVFVTTSDILQLSNEEIWSDTTSLMILMSSNFYRILPFKQKYERQLDFTRTSVNCNTYSIDFPHCPYHVIFVRPMLKRDIQRVRQMTSQP